ncbi:MAG: carboxypeptidase regulatory-like domain-containing protein [Acidobacteriota bacterium]
MCSPCRHKYLLILSLAIAVLATAVTGFAQVRSSTITIVATDSTGARVPDVKAEVLEEQTNQKFEGRTNNVGELTVPYLPAGRYTVTLQKEGFRPFTQTGLQLTTNQTASVAAQLQLGQAAQAVEVSAQAVQLQSESSSIQGATSEMAIDALPNLNSNSMYYATLQPGVVPANPAFYNTSAHEAFGIGYQSRAIFSAISVNGGEPKNMDIQLDGVPILGSGYNDATVLPNPEGILEVRVLLNNYTAENGRGQGVSSIITKSGTNQFHGSANYRLRNEVFNANPFGNKFYGTPRQAFKVHSYGAGIGGPIIKDKMFFFASYEGLKHSVGEYWRMTVPTAEERMGNFSHTLIPDQNGNPIAAKIYNPFQVTQIGTNLYQRAEVPNAIITNPTAYGLKLMGYYPEPNQTPTDIYGSNNFYYSGKQTFSKDSVNARVDYRLGEKHSIYGSGGFLNGDIKSPSPYGENNPFWSYASNMWNSQYDQDRNPYASVGDTIVLSPSLVMDIRYGVTRVASLSKSGDVDVNYDEFGIPAAIQAIMPSHNQAPDFCAGSRFSCLGMTDWGHKYTHQTSHNTTGSITKSLGHWTLKAGAEYRAIFSNYEDFAEGSVSIDPMGSNTEFLTADGGGVVQNTLPVQNGYAAANIFMGAASFHLTPGFDVRPAFASKYGGFYSQNDWRVNSKLTVNLGLRYEIQPAPTERYGRFSSFDTTAQSPFGGGIGAIYFPGNGHLWDTSYRDFGPRTGFAYSLTSNTVIRGGYGIVYNPTNTGFAPGPSRYGAQPFTDSVVQNMYGTSPNGMPAGTMDTGATAQVIKQVGAVPNAPQLYGTTSGFPRFNLHNYKNARVHQYNLAIETRLKDNWFVSLIYAGNYASNLPNFRVLSDPQFIPDATLDSWRDSYIASNGTDPGQIQVQNPLQPATGDLLPFSGVLGNRTISQLVAMSGNPLLTTLNVSSSIGSGYYNALEFHVKHAFSSGFLLDAHYTWSKAMANGSGDMWANASTYLQNPDLKDIEKDWHLGYFDTTHRVVATYIYSLPFGRGQRYDMKNAIGRTLISGWRIGGVTNLQSGFPLPITLGGGTGSLNHLPNRVSGVPVELPKSFQHFYDGKTQVTLPGSNRTITPCNGCYMKFNPDAFSMSMVTLANGRVVPNPYWYGNSALTYNDVRGPGRNNTDLNLSRTFHITESKTIDFIANVSNAFNHLQLSPNSRLDVGGVNTSDSPGSVTNLTLSGNNGTNAYEPRQVELKLRFQF